MSNFSGLTVDSKFYSTGWISENLHKLDAFPLSQHAKRTLQFCGEWISGKTRFEFQTSGTTGQPKVITLSREKMILSARMTGEFLDLNEGDRALVCLSPVYIAGIMMLVRGLELNLEITVVEPVSNPFKLQNPGCVFDFTAMVPTQVQSVTTSDKNAVDTLNQMKAILIGGAPVSLKLEKDLQQITAPIYHTFGMTETISHIALRRLNGPEASKAYTALPSVKIAQDERGCLTIKSSLTNDQVVITNDRVELESDNSFRWLGRIDHIINSGGLKVQAEKVERAIAEILIEFKNGEDERDFFVCGTPDKKFGEVVTITFEGAEFQKEVQERLLERLSVKLAKHEIPKKITFLESFIRTETDKISRSQTITNYMKL